MVSGSPCRTVSLDERGLEKRRFGLAGSTLAGVRREIGAHRVDRFRRKGKVKWSEGLAVNRQRGWVGFAGRRMEKIV